MIKQLLSIAAVVSPLLLSPSVKAATGDCEGTGEFRTDASEDWTQDNNVAGKDYVVKNSAIGSNYTLNCSCPAGSKVNLYYTVTSALITQGKERDFYRLNSNLDIKTQINDIPGNPSVMVPSNSYTPLRDGTGTYHANKNNSVCMADPANVRASDFSIGKNTTITLYVTTPFLGELNIPETHIASVQSAWTSTSAAPRPIKDIAKIYIQGRITVPQSCKINQGDTINVNLGFISAQRFTLQNQMPTGYTPVSFDITYDCGDMSQINNSLYMKIEGSDYVNQYNLVARRRESDDVPDVGIRLMDVTKGQVDVPFNPGIILLDKTGAGTTHFQAYPVNLVGGVLSTGPFKASATITVIVR